MPRVQVALGSLPVLSFELQAGITTVGRALTSGIVLPLPDVADVHLTLRVTGERVEIEAGPEETVLLNGTAVRGGRLGADDVLGIGPYSLRLVGGERGDALVEGNTIGSSGRPSTQGTVRRLVVVDGPDAGSVAFVDRSVAVIGRAPDCDLVLHDSHVSWHHVAIERAAQETRFRDLGSLNGTFLAGQQVDAARVTPGARITVGRSTILLADLAPSNGLRVELRPQPETLKGLAELVGTSPAMQRTYALIRKAAESLLPVLLSGETGTGKEIAARALHVLSDRARGPFVPLNCAAIPREIMESELFGHVRGAFTDAVTDHKGAFERAHGGTLFLDEIGELPLELQAKLLRALESGEIARLGGGHPLRTDARIVAATNRDLEAAAGDGRFRKDLYFRIAVLRLELPPLRARLGDIPALVHHFLRTAERDTGMPGADRVRVRPDALAPLEQHDWPGNVRELRNVIHRAVVECGGGEITRARIEALLAAERVSRPAAPPDARTLEEIEREAIENCLRDTGGRRRAAARRLGIAESTLYEKIKRYRLVDSHPAH